MEKIKLSKGKLIGGGIANLMAFLFFMFLVVLICSATYGFFKTPDVAIKTSQVIQEVASVASESNPRAISLDKTLSSSISSLLDILKFLPFLALIPVLFLLFIKGKEDTGEKLPIVLAGCFIFLIVGFVSNLILGGNLLSSPINSSNEIPIGEKFNNAMDIVKCSLPIFFKYGFVLSVIFIKLLVISSYFLNKPHILAKVYVKFYKELDIYNVDEKIEPKDMGRNIARFFV